MRIEHFLGSVGEGQFCDLDKPCAANENCLNGRCVAPLTDAERNSNKGVIIGVVAGGIGGFLLSATFGGSNYAKAGLAIMGAVLGGYAGEFAEHPLGRSTW